MPLYISVSQLFFSTTSSIGGSLSLNSTHFTIAVAGFLIAALVTSSIVPLIKKFALSQGLIDQPDERKQHETPMVRLGGIAMLFGFVIAISIGCISNGLGSLQSTEGVYILTAITGSIFCLFIGLADDFLELSPWPRLIFQITVAGGAWGQGLRIQEIDFSWIDQSNNIFYLENWLSLIITILWMVGITNAINWLDGLDGLAAGVSGIAYLTFFILSYTFNQPEAGYITAVTAGCCVGFLKHNSYPSTIMMGDGGSYFLGFNLACTSILICNSRQISIINENILINLIVLIVLAFPILDMFAVIMARIYNGISPFYPDRRHFHHRLLQIGFNHYKAVIIIYSIVQWLGALALYVAGTSFSLILLSISSAFLILMLYQALRQYPHAN